MRRPGRGEDLLLRRADLPVGDVVPDRSGEEPGVLQHHAEDSAHIFAAQVGGIDAVEADATGVDFVEAHQQVDNRRLACAGRSHDRDRLAGSRLQVEVGDQRLLRFVAERHVLEGNGSAALALARQRRGNGCRIRDFFFRIEEFEDALR